MKKKYRASISDSGSIDRLIKELETYKQSLNDRTRLLIEALAAEGIKILNAELSGISPYYREGKDGDIETNTGELVESDGKWSCRIHMSGGQALFVEFGAGAILNTSVGGSLHPKGAELGMTIGSYPDQTHADDPEGWWYTDRWGESQHTYGTPTFAPLYNTSEELIASIYEVAKRVYG